MLNHNVFIVLMLLFVYFANKTTRFNTSSLFINNLFVEQRK